MRGKLSLNRLLHNKKLILLFSILSAVAVWASVHTMSRADTHIISKTVNLNLSGTYAGNSGMNIFKGASQQVEVSVSGSGFVIYNLEGNDITLSQDYSKITGVGTWPVTLTPSQSVFQTDYSIIDVNPSTIEVFCDYVSTVTVSVEADITGVKIDEATGFQLGTPDVQSSGIDEDNSISIEGPKSVVSKIMSITAKVDAPKTISELTTFSASLIANDENGKKIDEKELELCTFIGLPDIDNKVNVIVPIQVQRTVKFKHGVINIPAGIKSTKNFITVTPPSIEIVGSPEQVETFAEDIANIGKFNLNHLSLKDTEQKVTLVIPQGIKVTDGTTEVKVSFNMKNFISKTEEITLTTKNTLVFKKPAGRSWTLPEQKINVTLIGNKNSINKIKSSDLTASIDMKDDNTTGVREYKATIGVAGYNDVWVYYGPKEPSGYTAYMTIK